MAFDGFNNVQLWSSDGGQSWNQGNLTAFNINSFACGGGVWVASAQGGAWRSTDGAQTWTQATGTVGQVSYSTSASAFFAAGFGTSFPTVWTSTDGTSWTETDNLGVAGFFNTLSCD